MNLRDKILRALYGGALVSSALGVAACADEPIEEENSSWGITDPWALENNATNNQSPNNQSPNNGSSNNGSPNVMANNESPNNGSTNGVSNNESPNVMANNESPNVVSNNDTPNNVSANNVSPNNSTANNGTANNSTSNVCDVENRELIELPYEGWEQDAYQFGFDPQPFIVCGDPDIGICDFDRSEPVEVTKFVRVALGAEDVCEPYPYYRGGEVCGPLPRGRDACCYVIEIGFDYCLEGRPFTVDGSARLASVMRRDGWCDPLDLEVEGLPEDLRLEIAAAWGEAGTHEHASVASFSRFMMDLMSLGAPRDLVEATTTAIADEIRHATACFSIGSVYAGYSLGPDEVDVRGSMEHAGDEAEILRAAIHEGCIGETLAAAQAQWAAPRVAHPEVRDALLAIGEDEGEHALLAWRFVDWMLQTRPHLEQLARETFLSAWEPGVSPYAFGVSEREREALAHGRVSGPLEDRIRRHAFHHTVIPCAEALFANRGSRAPFRWHEARA